MPYQAKPSKAVADLASHIRWFRRVPTSANLIGVEFRCQLVPAFPGTCPPPGRRPVTPAATVVPTYSVHLR